MRPGEVSAAPAAGGGAPRGEHAPLAAPPSARRWAGPAAAAVAAIALAWGGWQLRPSLQDGQGTTRGPLGAALFAEGADAPLQLLGPRALPQTATVAAAVAAPASMANAQPPGTGGRSLTPKRADSAARPAQPLQAASPEAAAAACQRFLKRLPTIDAATCAATRLADSGAASVQGTPLYWRDVGPPATPPASARAGGAAEPLRVLVVGAMHGDELTSAALALRWVTLAERQVGDASSTLPMHWRFIPILNPDGLLARQPTRVNARGVDLNRNFPTPNWERDAPIYWEKRTRRDPRRWPGPEPLSEPESRFLYDQMEQFAPDLVVSIHAPYGVLDYDGPVPPPSRLGRLRLDQLGIFPGSLGHYGSVRQGMPVVTIELQHELRMPEEEQVRQMWRDLLRWMGTHLARDGTGRTAS